LFSKWGDVTITADHRPHRCFVTLPSAEDATAAQADLDGAASLGSAPLQVKFAARCDECGMETTGQPQAQPLAAQRSADACAIPGLSLLPDFVSAEEEDAILQLVDVQQHWESLAKRRVLHFGTKFDYASRGLGGEEHPLPPLLRAVACRIEALPGSQAMDQLTVNEYTPGVGISPHVGERGCRSFPAAHRC
jgi:alkylated DNA repair protein alkB family protein 8